VGREKHRRVWPDGAHHTITVKATGEQWVRWHDAAGIHSMKPHLGTFLAKAADFYTARLQARRELAKRLDEQGKM
jgi:hypothetical protein